LPQLKQVAASFTPNFSSFNISSGLTWELIACLHVG
jgi:hypothetical protein